MMIAMMTLSLILTAGAGENPDTARLARELQGTPEEQRKALDFVIAHTATTPSFQMFVAAAIALPLGRLEDAAFLFYAAQLRARFDQERFPPVGATAPASSSER